MKLLEGDCCANCGTNLIWWKMQSKRNKVYVDDAEDLYCSKKCFKEYTAPSFKDLKEVKI